MKTKLKNAVADILNNKKEKELVEIFYTDTFEHGLYTTNIALKLAGIRKKNPLDIANDIITRLEKNRPPWVLKYEPAPPGYINIFVKDKFLASYIKNISVYGLKKGCMLRDKTIITEFTDPNPFKEFHIGHAFSNIVGESISRLYESQGAKIIRVCYQGDVGMHVAKVIWSWKKHIQKGKYKLEELSVKPLVERIEILGELYSYGAQAFIKDKSAQQEIKNTNKLIYNQDQSILELYKKGRQWSLEYFETLYKFFGTKFDNYFFEKETAKKGTVIVKAHINDGIFEKSRGAFIYKGEKKSLHTRVFINKQGFATYEAKDLGLALLKHETYKKYDKSIIITGNEINEYFKVVLSALSDIYPVIAQKTIHIGHGMLKLSKGKMSSRTGNVITARWLIDTLSKQVRNRMSGSRVKDKSGTIQKIVVGALKYAMLKQQIGGDIVFSKDKSVSLEGDSGPYIQYTYARCMSVIKKAELSKIKEPNTKSVEFNKEEQAIAMRLLLFPDILQSAVKAIHPHIIALYINTLASEYNRFYNKYRILSDKEGKSKQALRLLLTNAVAQTLKYGLNILGIEAVESM